VSWPFDPTVYAGLVAAFFGHAWLARRVDDAQTKHTLYFGLGLVTLWVALETPIDMVSDHYLDSVHMLQHVLLGFVAPPLMLLGLSPDMAGVLSRVPFVRAITWCARDGKDSSRPPNGPYSLIPRKSFVASMTSRPSQRTQTPQ